MSSRDIILEAIKSTNGKHPSRIPVALLSAGTWAFRQKGLTLKAILDKPDNAGQIIVAACCAGAAETIGATSFLVPHLEQKI